MLRRPHAHSCAPAPLALLSDGLCVHTFFLNSLHVFLTLSHREQVLECKIVEALEVRRGAQLAFQRGQRLFELGDRVGLYPPQPWSTHTRKVVGLNADQQSSKGILRINVDNTGSYAPPSNSARLKYPMREALSFHASTRTLRSEGDTPRSLHSRSMPAPTVGEQFDNAQIRCRYANICSGSRSAVGEDLRCHSINSKGVCRPSGPIASSWMSL